MSRFNLVFPDVDQLDENSALSYIQDIKLRLNRSKQQMSFFLNDNKIQLVSKEHGIFEDFIQGVDKFTHPKAMPVNDYCLFGKELYRFIKVEGFNPESAFDFGDLSYIGNYFISLKRIPSSQARKKLELYRRMNFSSTQQELRQYNAERGLDQADSLLEELTVGNEQLFNFELWFVVVDRDIRELDRKTDMVRSSLKQCDISYRIECFGTTHAAKQFLGQNQAIRFPLVAHTSFLVNLLPLSQEKVMDQGAKFKSRLGSDLFFELFNQKSNSYGMTISGATGQGKSKLGNKIIKEELERGARAVILDRNASYSKLCKFYDGIELAGKFNPLQFREPLYLKNLLISVIPKEDLSKQMEGELYLFLSELNLDSIESFSHLIELCSHQFVSLKLYFAELMESFDDSEIIDTHLLYVDFAKYPDQIKPVLLVFIIQYFYSLSGKKVILLDECHHLLRNNVEFVERLFRELRKQMGAPIALTQNFSDFVSSEIGRVIANNSYYNVFLRQNIQTSDFITSDDQRAIQQLETKKGIFSEFYLKSPMHNKTMRFYPKNLEYELFTSDYQENEIQKNFFANLLASGMDFKNIMTAWTRIKYAMD